MPRLTEGTYIDGRISLNLGSIGEENGSSVKQWTFLGCVAHHWLPGERAAVRQKSCWHSLAVDVWGQSSYNSHMLQGEQWGVFGNDGLMETPFSVYSSPLDMGWQSWNFSIHISSKATEFWGCPLLPKFLAFPGWCHKHYTILTECWGFLVKSSDSAGHKFLIHHRGVSLCNFIFFVGHEPVR